jgi:CHAD domain-containing protein
MSCLPAGHAGSGERTGGRLVAEYLAAQRDALVAADPGVRAGEADAVHEMRTASRRLRSTLRTFRALWRPGSTEPLRAELRWLGGLLGAVRDTDVLAALLAAALDAEDPALIVGPVAQRLDRRLAADAGTARAALAHSLAGDRYATLLDRLAATVAAPPAAASYRQIRARASAALHRADRRLDTARHHPTRSAAQPPDEAGRPTATPADEAGRPTAVRTDEAGRPAATPAEEAGRPAAVRAGEPDRAALHDARKAYKRARYAAEVLAPVAGEPADRLIRRFRELQDVLGDLHDAWLAADVLHAHAAAARLAGEHTAGYELLAAHRTAAADELLTRVPRAQRRAREPGVRRWLERG